MQEGNGRNYATERVLREKVWKEKRSEQRADPWDRPYVGAGEKRRTRERHVENESEKLQGVVSTGKAEKRSEEGWPTVPSAILPKGKKIKKQ